jgi:peptidoglycan biosynthesis protein MviN/MurJ (putative lipid II flippase)
VVAFVVLSLILTPVIGLAGIPLSAALTFTTQALVLLNILNRRYPGILQIGTTVPRSLAAALIAGGVALAIINFLPLATLLTALAALAVGVLAALPFIQSEVKLLLKL